MQQRHCQSEIVATDIEAVIFSSPRQTRRSFAMGRLKAPLAVFTSTCRTIIRLSGKTRKTRPICQLLLECPSPAIRATAPSWILFRLVVHFCRGRRVGKYSRPVSPELICHSLYLPPTSTNITVVLSENTWCWSRGTSLKQRWFGVRGSLSLGSKVTGVRARELRIASTSTINVASPSSVRVCPDTNADRIFRADRMSRSQTPPMWLAVGGLNFPAMPRCRSSLWIDWVKTLQFFSKDTFCSYEIGTIIAAYAFRLTPSTNEASKCVDEGIGR